MPEVVARFRRAAGFAKQAGLDGIEVHAGDGHLIDRFLRDGTNHRLDAYGGSVVNRVRLSRGPPVPPGRRSPDAQPHDRGRRPARPLAGLVTPGGLGARPGGRCAHPYGPRRASAVMAGVLARLGSPRSAAGQARGLVPSHHR
ncbi:hypothetical protein [Streptomyces sp. NPDC057052]|uniref:oxidoreductase n=1 Tax=Streptomyces sp. NPDC057052 TaxID=3346010 RepID=UPI003632ECDC